MRLKTLLTIALLAASGLHAADDDSWWLEFEAMPGYANNYFFRGEGARAPDTNLFSLYALGEKEWKKGKGKFSLDFDAGLVWVLDIDNADYYDLNVGGAYKRGTRKYTADFTARPNQVFEEEGAPIFFDLTALEVGIRQNFTPGMWLGFEYEYERQDFDRLAELRDARVDTFALSYRYPVTARYGLRGTVIYENKEADGPRFNNRGPGVALAVEGQPSDRVQFFFRFKYRERDFPDATQEDDRNFERTDKLSDLIFNITWRFAAHWGVRFESFLRDGSSTRPDRNYTGNRLYAGMVYRLP